MKNYNTLENQLMRRILLTACATALAVAFKDVERDADDNN